MDFSLKGLLAMKEENERKKVSLDPTNYSYLLFSVEDGGKTSLSSALFEGKHVMLSAEHGAKSAMYANSIPVANYRDLQKVTKTLATEEAVKTLGGICIVDTTTKVGDYIETYILNKHGKEFMGDVKAMGQAYPLINRYFNELFDPMKAVGWVFVWICHADPVEMTDENGETYIKYYPSTQKRIAQIIKREVDYCWFIDKIDTKNGSKRVLYTDECNKCFGKNKTNKYSEMPLTIDLEKNEMDSAKKIWKALEESIMAYGKDNVTRERGHATIGEFKEKERDIKEIIDELVKLGGLLSDIDKRTDAIEIMNKALGTDHDGNQRSLNDATQSNAEALEIAVDKMKDLYEKNK